MLARVLSFSCQLDTCTLPKVIPVGNLVLEGVSRNALM